MASIRVRTCLKHHLFELFLAFAIASRTNVARVSVEKAELVEEQHADKDIEIQ